MRATWLAAPMAVAVGWLLGCTAQDSLQDVDPSGQTVTFWHQHTGSRAATLQGLVDEFNEQNPHKIRVESVYAGEYGEIYDRMPQAFQSGAPPELVVAYANQAHPYFLSGWVVDLKPYMASATWGLSDADRDDYFQTFIEQDEVAGVQVAFPPHRSMEVLYANGDWLEELGEKDPPATWEAFAQLCHKARQQPYSKATATSSIGLVIDADASRLAAMVFSRGGRFLSADKKRYTLDSPQMRASLELLRDLVDGGDAELAPEAADVRKAFASGRALFILRSSAEYPTLALQVKAGAGFYVTAAAPPFTGDHPVVDIYGASLAVAKTTPQKQLAAWLFIRWLTAPEQQARWVEETGYHPVRKSTARHYLSYLRTPYNLLETGVSEPAGVWYDPVRRMLADAMLDVLHGGDLDQVLCRVDWEANNLLMLRQ